MADFTVVSTWAVTPVERKLLLVNVERAQFERERAGAMLEAPTAPASRGRSGCQGRERGPVGAEGHQAAAAQGAADRVGEPGHRQGHPRAA
jgi:hypothetical protein